MTLGGGGPVLDFVAENAPTKLRTVAAETEEFNREYAFILDGYPRDVRASRIVSGDESTVDFPVELSDSGTPTLVTLHTHPNLSTVPSETDWHHFFTQVALYGNIGPLPADWKRGEVIVAPERTHNHLVLNMRAIYLTNDAGNLSPTEQWDWAERARGRLETGEWLLGDTEEAVRSMGPRVGTETKTIAAEEL
jgi:hypothetical protein